MSIGSLQDIVGLVELLADGTLHSCLPLVGPGELLMGFFESDQGG